MIMTLRDTNPRMDTFLILCDAIGIDPGTVFQEELMDKNGLTEEMIYRLIDVVPDIHVEEIAYVFDVTEKEAENYLIKADKELNMG